MTKEFEYLVHAAACTARGEKVTRDDSNLDWNRLVRLAREQSVAFLLAYQMRKNQSSCPAELRQEWSSRLFSNVLEHSAQRERVISLLQEMEQAGFRPVLLKGYAAAACYAVPDCRISSDVDILLSPRQEAAACRFLQKKGFEVSPRWTDGHHSVCSHPDYGRLELHAVLFDRLVADIWLQDLKQELFDPREICRLEIGDGSCLTLGDTDHLLFMTLHMVKHFINGGASLRMLLDLPMFMQAHGANIDFARYWEVLTVLNYASVVRSALWAMVRFGGFREEDIPGLKEEVEAHTLMLLEDMERGGWIGSNNPDESHESHVVYSMYMQRKGRKHYRVSLLKQKLSHGFRRVFPARVVMMRYCPGAAESLWLLPLAWGKHLMHGISVLLQKKSAPAVSAAPRQEMPQQHRERIAMLKNMGIMQENC